MNRRPLIWTLYPAYLAIILVSIAVSGWFATAAVREFYLDQARRDLLSRSDLIRETLPRGEQLRPGPELDAICTQLARAGAVRVSIIAPSGAVLADSGGDRAAMENHASRPEVERALAGQTGSIIRFSQSINHDLLYLAQPLYQGSEIVGVLRVAIPLIELDQAVQRVYQRLILGGLLLAAMAASLGLLMFVRLVGQPLGSIKRSALRIAQGELDHRATVPAAEELGGLAQAINAMSSQLSQQIAALTQQSHEQQAVLASMHEGVLAVDHEGRLLRLNRAAADLLDADTDCAVGRRIQEVVRNTQLKRFIDRALAQAGHSPVEEEITLAFDYGARTFKVHGTLLLDASSQAIGALIVFHDVTRMRQLENIRRDFVANVSHELKTPVTAIVGAAEMLSENELAEEDAQRFTTMIVRQGHRLSRIIDDLLQLSRLEQEAGREIELTPGRLRSVLAAAIDDCQAKAAQRGVTLGLTCPDQLTASINAPLLEQAVLNLLDNAIMHSQASGVVEVEARTQGEQVVIQVRDDGCGIPPEHLPRLFERFYRVDKSRSRQLGGTGLGLAIVKHIAQAHRGWVSVHSVLNEGSVFTIHLPLVQIAAPRPDGTSQAHG